MFHTGFQSICSYLARLSQRPKWSFLIEKCLLYFVNLHIFNFFFRITACSFRDLVEVLFFSVIWNPRWLCWSLIGLDILDLFSRTTACDDTRLARNVPLRVLKKCCYLSRVMRNQIWHWHFFTSFPKLLCCWECSSMASEEVSLLFGAGFSQFVIDFE